jgi:hypothetical protein
VERLGETVYWSIGDKEKPCVELVILVLLVSLVDGKDCDSEWVNE